MTDAPKSENAVKSLEGWQAPLATASDRRAAIDAAFDYRGDITVETTDGQTIHGYVYDRRADADPPILKLMPADAPGSKVDVAYDRIAKLTFTGRDTAAGKSWETWVKKYIEKKQAGETASIEPEKLD